MTTETWREHFYAALARNDYRKAYRILGYQDGLAGEFVDYLVPPGELREAYHDGHEAGKQEREDMEVTA